MFWGGVKSSLRNFKKCRGPVHPCNSMHHPLLSSTLTIFRERCACNNPRLPPPPNFPNMFRPGSISPRALCPQSRFLHVPPNFPTTKWSTRFGLPWWRDQTRVVGKVTIWGDFLVHDESSRATHSIDTSCWVFAKKNWLKPI